MTTMTSIEDLNIGDSVFVERTVSESDVYQFSGITGDMSPNHLNERYMEGSRFKTRIAQGALIVGLTSAAAAEFGIRYNISGVSAGYDRIRFTGPVFFGDTIKVTYEITRIDSERGRAVAGLKATNQRGETVLVGSNILAFVDREEQAS